MPLIHYFHNAATNVALCGEENPAPPAEMGTRDCLGCDRIVRDRGRAAFGYPPFTDAEYFALRAKLDRPAGRVLVVRPDHNGRL